MLTIDLDVAECAPAGVEHLGADVFLPDPETLRANTAVVVCFPGGGISRRYFDLDTPGCPDAYSMARYLAAAGIVVVTIDPPAVGASDRPVDGYTLTPHTVADLDACATTEILDRLRVGSLDADYPPLPDLTPIGLGHSAGALLAVVQQARHESFAALVLLGFHGRGLPAFLTPEELRYAEDPVALRSAIARLAEARFGEPLPQGTAGDSSFLTHGQPSETALTAMRYAGAPLLALVGLTAMIPGSVGEELGEIDVPVFLGVGEFDITGPGHAIPGELPASQDVTLFVLPDAGHNHNVGANRVRLWRHIANWVGLVDKSERAESEQRP